MKRTFAILASLGFASAALAADVSVRSLLVGDDTACYGRKYDEAHMEAHPDQRTREIAVWWSSAINRPDAPTDRYYVQVQVGFQGMQGYMSNLGECQDDGSGARCLIECDGGGFNVEMRGAADMTLRIPERLWLVQCDGPPEGLTEEFVELGPHSDDKVFALGRLSDEDCAFVRRVAVEGVEGDSETPQ